MANCTCPLPAALTTIPDNTCPIKLDRIRKFGVRRQYAFHSVTTGDASTVAQYKTLAEWADTLAAANIEKTLISGKIGEVTIVPGAAITSEFDGDTKNTGSYEPTTVNFQMSGMSSAQLAAMRALSCEPVLYFEFYDKDGNIIHNVISTVPGGFEGVGESFQLTDMSQEEPGGEVKATGSFQLVDGWSVDGTVTVTTPDDFNPLTDLSN